MPKQPDPTSPPYDEQRRPRRRTPRAALSSDSRRSPASGEASPAAGTPPSREAPPAASGFYAGALDESDRRALGAARGVTGLDQEIAVLRLRLRRLLAEQPDDFPLVVRGMELLVRAVGTARRLDPAEAGGVLEQISAELDGIFTLLAEARADPG